MMFEAEMPNIFEGLCALRWCAVVVEKRRLLVLKLPKIQVDNERQECNQLRSTWVNTKRFGDGCNIVASSLLSNIFWDEIR